MPSNVPGLGPSAGERAPARPEQAPSLDLASAALAALPVGVIVQSPDGGIVSCNRAAERILGLTREQIAGRTSLDPSWRAVHEDGSPFPGESHPAMVTLRTGEACRNVAMGVHKSDGKLVWLSVSSEPIPGPGGRPGAVTTAFVDVTARVGAEERYRTLSHEMLNGFALHEIVRDTSGTPLDYRFLAVNPAFERMTGLKSGQIVGRTVLEVMPGTERHWIETYGKVAATGQPVHFESYAAELGKHFDVMAYRPAPGQFACVFEDVTERKLAVEDLARREALLHSIVEGTTDVIVAKDVLGRYLLMNAATERSLGRRAADVLGRDDTALFPPDEARRVMDDDRGVLETGATRTLVETVTDAGGPTTFLTTKGPIRDAEGRVAGLFAIAHDITERIATEASLRVKDAAIASSISGIAISDISARVTYANDAFVRMWGYETADEVVGMSIRDFVQDPATVAPAVEAARTAGSWIGEFVARRKDGTTFQAQLAANRADDKDGHPVCLLASFLDISERRKAVDRIHELNTELEQRVRERTAELEAANRELDGFSYSISHDLRAPLRAIEGFSAIVARDHEDNLDPEIQRFLGLIRKNARRMSGLIDDLLTFSRSSRTEVRRSQVDMRAIIRSAFTEVVEGAGADERVDLRLGEVPDVEGDPSLLRQVWVNLLSNAVKYSAKQDHPVVEVDGAVEGGSVRYRVRDNGVGFDMAYAHKLFGVFQRLHGISEFEGTGIGLALVKRIVNRHGGRVWAEGELGRGATFSFSLPTGERSEAQGGALSPLP